jgi:hypothetical protein
MGLPIAPLDAARLNMFLEASWTSSTVIGCVWNLEDRSWCRRRLLFSLAVAGRAAAACLGGMGGEEALLGGEKEEDEKAESQRWDRQSNSFTLSARGSL